MSGNHKDSSAMMDSLTKLAIVAGLIITGVAFMLALAYAAGNSRVRQFPGAGQGFELEAVEQNLPELKLFLSKYNRSDMTYGFGRSQNGTIHFTYVLGGRVDKDGNGYGEINRRLELSILYDESGGHMLTDIGNYDPARVKQIEIRCREQVASSLDVDKAFADVVPPAYDGQVKDFIENVDCFSLMK